MTVHPLAALIASAAVGRFPAADGGWRRVPLWRPGIEAVFAFTGHACFAVDTSVADDALAGLGADGLGGAHHPRLVTTIAGPGAWIDSLDAILVRTSSGGTTSLVDRPDLRTHPRVQHAEQIRDVRSVLGYEDPRDTTVAVIAAGIAGLAELSFELDPLRRGSGLGRRLVEDACNAVPAGDLIVAGVAPGNAASLRTLLAAGFAPIGSVQLFRRAG